MNISTLKTTVIGSLLFGLTSGLPAEAALMVLSQSAEVNLDSNSVLFQIEFNRVPDFFTTTTEYYRQADFFQYYIDADGGLPIFKNQIGEPYYINIESIIRGTEIYLEGDVRIRNALPPDPDLSSSGGWGSIRGSVPYTLSGNVFSFLVPLQLIGDTDGQFSYQLLWGEYSETEGETVGYIEAETVPEPGTIFGSVMALGGLAAFQRKNKQLKGLCSRFR
jgi:hypothetical protein